MRLVWRFLFLKIAGWKIMGDVPRDLSKYLIVVAPHSSNWDFFIGLAVRSILRFQSNYLAKKELFDSPLGWLFRKLGGYPVDRSGSHNMVDQVVDIINKERFFVIAIAPEGTRKKVTKWKTGFYHISVKANIPLVFASLDYGKKVVTFSKPFYPIGEINKDAVEIMSFFKGVKGKNRNVMPMIEGM